MAEYTFGTHAKAIDQAESVKSKVWGPARNKAGLLACTFIVVGQQAYTNVQPVISPSVRAGTGPSFTPRSRISAAPQFADLTLQPVIRASLPAPAVTPQPIIRYYTSGPQLADLTLQPLVTEPPPARQGVLGSSYTIPPQLVDLTLQGIVDAPLAMPQGRLGAQITASPQDQTQLAACVWPSLTALVAIPNPVATYYSLGPQLTDLSVQPRLFAPPLNIQGFAVRSYVVNAPLLDTTIQAYMEAPQQAPQGVLGSRHFAYPIDTTQIQPQLFASLRAFVPIPNPVAPFYALVPQFLDTTLQPQLWRPTPLPQGQLGAQVNAYPTDTRQVAPVVWSSLVPPPIAPNPAAPYFKTYPQFEERATVAIWPAQKVGSTPGVAPQGQSAPQSIDLTQKSVFSRPTPANQGVLGAQIIVPQADTTQLQPQIFLSARAILVIANPVAPFYALAPQLVDLSLQPVITTPLLRPQGRVPPSIFAGQQINDLTPGSQFYPTPVRAIILGQYIQRFVFVPEQANTQPNPTQTYATAGNFVYTIDGAPQKTISSAYGSITVYCDGNTHYYTIS